MPECGNGDDCPPRPCCASGAAFQGSGSGIANRESFGHVCGTTREQYRAETAVQKGFRRQPQGVEGAAIGQARFRFGGDRPFQQRGWRVHRQLGRLRLPVAFTGSRSRPPVTPVYPFVPRHDAGEEPPHLGADGFGAAWNMAVALADHPDPARLPPITLSLSKAELAQALGVSQVELVRED